MSIATPKICCVAATEWIVIMILSQWGKGTRFIIPLYELGFVSWCDDGVLFNQASKCGAI